MQELGTPPLDLLENIQLGQLLGFGSGIGDYAKRGP